jgi:hypothetical protein
MLFPSPVAAIAMGAVLVVVGIPLSRRAQAVWPVLGSILLVLGAILLCEGILRTTMVLSADGAILGHLGSAAILALCAVLGDSGLLAAGSVCLLLGALGSWTGYGSGAYMLCISQPIATIVAFSALAAGLLAALPHLPEAHRRIARIAGCMAVVAANLGFWVGSIWGGEQRGLHDQAHLFAMIWAILLLGALGFGIQRNDRWLVNAAAVFASIHLYTQWFALVQFSAPSVIVAGIGLIVLAGGFLAWNRSMMRAPAATPQAP